MPTRLRSLPLASFAAILLMLAGAVSPAEAQFGKKLKNALKHTAEDKAIQKTTETENKAIDSALSGGSNGGGAAAPAAAASKRSRRVERRRDGKRRGDGRGGFRRAAQAGRGRLGQLRLQAGRPHPLRSDFGGDEVGDFPKGMEFKSGALETVEWLGARWLRASQDSKFYLVLPDTLASQFTMEFDYSIPYNGEVWIYFPG